MRYITTSCRNCGFKIRNRESGVPSVQIGTPVLRCPKCGHLILDSIQTEYEFMTNNEKARFSTQAALPKSYIGNILFIVVGMILLIGGIVTGNTYLWIGLIGGGGCIAIGIYQIFRNQKMASDKAIEQAVYESLKRTENKAYVEFLKNAYKANGIKRIYLPDENKVSFFEQNKEFELRESYKENMNNFIQLWESIDRSIPIERSRNYIN